MGNELHLSNFETKVTESNYSKAILQPISYFDIFDFPLTSEEILKFSPAKLPPAELNSQLNKLTTSGKIHKHENYYLPAFSSVNNVLKRKENEKRAKSIEQKVKRYSKLISRFPFIRCVCISGSYSKGVITVDGDVDFFIITQPGRLWLSRTLLVLFKKLILLNSRKYFCVNYFIDSDHLEIPDKNLFSATEIKTLIPAYNHSLYLQFIKANSWINELLPHSTSIHKKETSEYKASGFKRFLEKILNGKMGEKLDELCFRITLKRWKKKFKHFNEEDFDLNMRTKKNVSKHHPQGFQNKVLKALDERLKRFSEIK